MVPHLTCRFKDLATLKPGEWLNDEVIHFYIYLVVEAARTPYTNIHVLSSFFKDILMTRAVIYKDDGSVGDVDYSQVGHFTNKVKPPLHRRRLTLLPVNLHQLHWVLVAIGNEVEELTLVTTIDWVDPFHSEFDEDIKKALRKFLQVLC